MATEHTWTVLATGVHTAVPPRVHKHTHTLIHNVCSHTHANSCYPHVCTHTCCHTWTHMCTHTQPHAGLQLHAQPLLHLLPCNQSPGPGTRHPGRNMTRGDERPPPTSPCGCLAPGHAALWAWCPGGNMPVLGQSRVPWETSPPQTSGDRAQGPRTPTVWRSALPGPLSGLRAQEGLTSPPSKPLPNPPPTDPDPDPDQGPQGAALPPTPRPAAPARGGGCGSGHMVGGGV